MYKTKRRRSKLIRVSGIVPGCCIKALVHGEIVTSKVIAVREVADQTSVVCKVHGKPVQISLSDCQLYRPVVANITFNTNGEIINEKKSKSSHN